MSKESKAKKQLGHPIPLKISRELESQLRTLSQKTNLSMADLMRLSIERGFVAVEKMLEQPAEQTA